MTFVKVQIPVKRYVKRFLEVKYGEPALLQRNDNIGKYFYELVDHPNQERDSRIKLSRYTDHVTIGITKTIFLQRGYVLTPTNVVAFNNFVEDHISVALEYFVCGAVIVGEKKRSMAYRTFLDIICLNESELAFETLKKKIDRSGIFKNTGVAA